DLVTFRVPALKKSANNTMQVEERYFFRMPVIICFESLFSNLVRKFIKPGADILVIITNDAWFGRSPAPYHHAQAAVFRAIENRIAIARCANTGKSMFIDCFGRTKSETPIFERMTLVDEIPLRSSTTFFTMHGHVFAVAVSLLNIIPFLIALIRQIKN
ncbi:MAG: nitrilase-related carbon-nitrogen hydrolase, partial [bacterium]|nr:nitrilase-related carbon-nitrogen hydrolase [bacterium]